jgi:hypothetical protein
MFTVVVPSAGDRWVANICLMLITTKPKFTNPPEMSSAGVVNGRCLYKLLGLGIEGEVWEVIALEVRAGG